MAKKNKNPTIFWGMSLETSAFKKSLKRARNRLKRFSYLAKKDFKAIAASGKKLAFAGVAIGAGLAFVTKKSIEAINAQKILADSIGTSQSKMAGLELATQTWNVKTKLAIDKMREVGGYDEFARLADQVKGAGTAQDQLNKSIELFGNQGGKLLPVLQLGSKGLADMEQEAFKLGLALSPAEINKATGAWAQFEKATFKLKGLGNVIGSSFSEPFARVFKTFNGFMDTYAVQIKSFFKGIGEDVNDLIIKGVNAFADYGIPAFNAFVSFANQIGDAFANVFAFISSTGGSTFATFGSFFQTMIDFFATIRESIGVGISNAISFVIKGAFVGLGKMSEFMGDMITKMAFGLAEIGAVSDSFAENIAMSFGDQQAELRRMSKDFSKPFDESAKNFEKQMTDKLIQIDIRNDAQQQSFKSFLGGLKFGEDAQGKAAAASAEGGKSGMFGFFKKVFGDQGVLHKGVFQALKFVKETAVEDKPGDKSPMTNMAKTLMRGSEEEFRVRNQGQNKLLKETQKQTKELAEMNRRKQNRVIV